MIYVCNSKCMFKSELWIFTEKIGNTLHGLGKFHLDIFAVKKVSESCPINNFQVNKALVTPETYISCLFLSFSILPPFHHLPTHIGVTFSYFVQWYCAHIGKYICSIVPIVCMRKFGLWVWMPLIWPVPMMTSRR